MDTHDSGGPGGRPNLHGRQTSPIRICHSAAKIALDPHPEIPIPRSRAQRAPAAPNAAAARCSIVRAAAGRRWLPSISASNGATTEAWTWSCSTLRTGARPSISSKKMIDGWLACACRNSWRRWISLFPRGSHPASLQAVWNYSASSPGALTRPAFKQR
eukprot:gene2555-biopygen1429